MSLLPSLDNSSDELLKERTQFWTHLMELDCNLDENVYIKHYLLFIYRQYDLLVEDLVQLVVANQKRGTRHVFALALLTMHNFKGLELRECIVRAVCKLLDVELDAEVLFDVHATHGFLDPSLEAFCESLELEFSAATHNQCLLFMLVLVGASPRMVRQAITSISPHDFSDLLLRCLTLIFHDQSLVSPCDSSSHLSMLSDYLGFFEAELMPKSQASQAPVKAQKFQMGDWVQVWSNSDHYAGLISNVYKDRHKILYYINFWYGFSKKCEPIQVLYKIERPIFAKGDTLYVRVSANEIIRIDGSFHTFLAEWLYTTSMSLICWVHTSILHLCVQTNPDFKEGACCPLNENGKYHTKQWVIFKPCICSKLCYCSKDYASVPGEIVEVYRPMDVSVYYVRRSNQLFCVPEHKIDRALPSPKFARGDIVRVVGGNGQSMKITGSQVWNGDHWSYSLDGGDLVKEEKLEAVSPDKYKVGDWVILYNNNPCELVAVVSADVFAAKSYGCTDISFSVPTLSIAKRISAPKFPYGRTVYIKVKSVLQETNVLGIVCALGYSESPIYRVKLVGDLQETYLNFKEDELEEPNFAFPLPPADGMWTKWDPDSHAAKSIIAADTWIQFQNGTIGHFHYIYGEGCHVKTWIGLALTCINLAEISCLLPRPPQFKYDQDVLFQSDGRMLCGRAIDLDLDAVSGSYLYKVWTHLGNFEIGQDKLEKGGIAPYLRHRWIVFRHKEVRCAYVKGVFDSANTIESSNVDEMMELVYWGEEIDSRSTRLLVSDCELLAIIEEPKFKYNQHAMLKKNNEWVICKVMAFDGENYSVQTDLDTQFALEKGVEADLASIKLCDKINVTDSKSITEKTPSAEAGNDSDSDYVEVR